MNTRMSFRCFLFIVCLGAALFLLPKTVYAVPGKGTGDAPYTSEGCKSKTFDLIKPEDLPSDGDIGIPKIKGKKQLKVNKKNVKLTNLFFPEFVIKYR